MTTTLSPLTSASRTAPTMPEPGASAAGGPAQPFQTLSEGSTSIPVLSPGPSPRPALHRGGPDSMTVSPREGGNRPGSGQVVRHKPLRHAEDATVWDRLRFRPPEHSPKAQHSSTSSTQPAAAELAPRSAATAILTAAEILAGHRPAEQLARWSTPTLFKAVARRAGLAQRLLGQGAHGPRPRLRSVHAQRALGGDYEVTALLTEGNRLRAAAGRLTSYRGRWVLSCLEIA